MTEAPRDAAAPEPDADQGATSEEEAAIRAAFESLAFDRATTAEPEEAMTRAGAEVCPVDAARPALAPGRWPVRSAWYEGGDQFQSAVRDAERSLAPLLIYFYTDWCGYCRRLERGLLSDSGVRRVLRDRVVKLRVNPEDGPRDREVAERFGVRGYPKLVVLSQPSGNARGLSPYRPGGGADLLPPDEFVAKLEREEDSSLRAFLDRARGHLARESYFDAIEAADAALAIGRGAAGAFECRARAQLALGRLDVALSDLRACAESRRDDATPYSLAATALAQKERWSESAACLGKALDRRPDPSTFFARARALAAAGDLRGAAVDARRACEMGAPGACEWDPGAEGSRSPS